MLINMLMRLKQY